jgi:hypothetical protein
MHGQYIAATHNKLTRAVAIRANGRARTGSHFQRAKLIMVTGDLPKVADLRAYLRPTLAAWHQSRAVAAHHHPETSASRSDVFPAHREQT